MGPPSSSRSSPRTSSFTRSTTRFPSGPGAPSSTACPRARHRPRSPTTACTRPRGPVPLPAYPPVPSRPYATAARSPVTQHAPYPGPCQVAAGQAAALATIPAVARENISTIISSGTPPADSDIAYLTAVFGADVLAAYGLTAGPAGDPAGVLRLLLDRLDVLLEGKLGRLAQLARQARAGRVLTLVGEGSEPDWGWGAGTRQPIDPDRP